MVDPSIAALALSGATTLVAAMATDMWQSARERMAQIFRRGGQQAAVESQLDLNNGLVEQADDDSRTRQILADQWQLQLETLLRQHPEAADELRELVGELSADMPAERHTWVQNNTARDNARQYAAMGGNVIVHEASSQAPAPTPLPGPAPLDVPTDEA
ncbi:hypothetical protein OG361_31140 [Streptomyces sp. NBC_00090]|uniref:hypothetical protein n=1 Tax=Streptomyces sp. NBC_00090 TaxID=2903619 RepID=UPI00324679DE